MTAQIGDKYMYYGEEYSIVALSNPVQFDPVYYGITPSAATTACWAGYWCEYDISEKGLILDKLYINSKDGSYPDINGVSAKSESKTKPYEYMEHHLYEGLDMHIDYTGRIVAGAGFLREHYIHMGYQRAWAYETLVEFVFKNGSLLNTIDHSHDAAQIRAGVITSPSGLSGRDGDDISDFITDSFSLDLKTKLWWLKDHS